MIRPASAADVSALVTLGQTFLQTGPYAHLVTPDPVTMAATVRWLLGTPQGTVIVSQTPEGVVRGMIGLFAFPHHLSGALTVGEVFFYVAPAARGLDGMRLLRAAKRWAQAVGATTLQLVAPEGEDRVEALYAALDCAPLERAWVMTL
jgi:GNAT superfamily N-acetyltransferase